VNRLSIETATAACSVALTVDGRRSVRREFGSRVHARVLLPWVRELLAEAGIGYSALDDIAVDRGPGGFTSLRLGLGVAQGIALAHDLPVRPVSSLAALALAGCRESDARVLAVLDARMGEVYAGWFEIRHGLPVAAAQEWLGAPGELPLHFKPPFRAVGSGFAVHGGQLLRRLGIGSDAVEAGAEPTAEAVCTLAEAVAPVAAHELEPVYLRDRVTG
jgi:tRNA threonylcarbamoyladenosine biosynthesis protein TsaB